MDEAHHFLLAKDSASFSELYRNAAYDGHPLLWDSLLFIITRFSDSPFYMQLLNISIMSGSVYLFLKHAPFKTLFSVLIVFGYFFIYEYHIISRNYAISILLITLVFVQLNKPTKNHLLIAFCLLLLSFTHVYSILVAIALSMIFIFQNKNSNVKYIYCLHILICAGILFSLQVPADHFLFKFDTDRFLSYKRIGKAFSVYLKGFLPIPDITAAKVWNSNLIVSFSKGVGTVLSVLFALIPFFIFKKNKLVLFFFYFSTLGICLFIYLSPIIVALRYCGFIFMILIFSFWLQKILYPSETISNPVYKNIALSILIIHIFSGTYLFVIDLNQPFSNSKTLANYLKENHLDNKEIFLSNLSSGPPVSAHLNKKLIYLETEEKNSYCKWNTWPFILTKIQLGEKLDRLVKNDSSLLILNNTYLRDDLKNSAEDLPCNYKAVKLVTFDGAMLPSENYNLYYLVKK
ncbi:MAG: hypothetical protein ABIP51_17955 [Bacteroidia bacterium]